LSNRSGGNSLVVVTDILIRIRQVQLGQHGRVQDADDENRGFAERAIENRMHASEQAAIRWKVGRRTTKLRHLGDLLATLLKEVQIAVTLLEPHLSKVWIAMSRKSPRAREVN
jgi:hypothetical protein